jgi:hypothetical protein
VKPASVIDDEAILSVIVTAITVCLVAITDASAAMASTGQVVGVHVGASGGTWGTAMEVPGSAQLNEGGHADVTSVSCASVGNCSAGGYYFDGSHVQQAFVVNETNGTWRTAKEVPGTAALNSGGYASIYSISCASAGNCSAGGTYTDSFNHLQAFVVNETNGTWSGAIEVPGTVVLNQGGTAATGAVSCASVGHCSAGGNYTDSSNLSQAFVVNES